MLSPFQDTGNEAVLHQAAQLAQSNGEGVAQAVQEMLAKRSEFLKVAYIPHTAFRNTLNIMARQCAKFSAEQLVCVGAHGFAFASELEKFMNNQ